MSSGVLFFWLICAAVAAVISERKNLGPLHGFILGGLLSIIGVIIVICQKPGAPKGMYAAKCCRCNTVQNVVMGQAEFECWQCKTAQHVVKGVLS